MKILRDVIRVVIIEKIIFQRAFKKQQRAEKQNQADKNFPPSGRIVQSSSGFGASLIHCADDSLAGTLKSSASCFRSSGRRFVVLSKKLLAAAMSTATQLRMTKFKVSERSSGSVILSAQFAPSSGLIPSIVAMAATPWSSSGPV